MKICGKSIIYINNQILAIDEANQSEENHANVSIENDNMVQKQK